MFGLRYSHLVDLYPHINNCVSIVIYCITLTRAYPINTQPSFQDIHVSIWRKFHYIAAFKLIYWNLSRLVSVFNQSQEIQAKATSLAKPHH